jgi:hypothetical protein
MRLRFALLVLLTVTSAVVAAERRSQQPHNQSNQQQAAPDKRGTEQAPLIVQTRPPDKSQEEIQRDKEKAKLDRETAEFTGDLAFYTKLLFGATVALALITVALAGIGFWQAQDNKAAIKAAQTSANAAMLQINIMKATHAAHVSIIQPKSSVLTGEQRNLLGMRFWVTLVNNGHSETQNMRSTISGRCLPLNEPFVYDFPGALENPPHSMVIGAQSEINTGEIDIPGEGVMSTANRQAQLFLFGWVEYDDIFPDTMRHRLEYCFEVRIQAGGTWLTNFDHYGPHNRHYNIPRPPTPAA